MESKQCHLRAYNIIGVQPYRVPGTCTKTGNYIEVTWKHKEEYDRNESE
jgi:hypothetical protein